ncbi:hypothetical protein [Fructobacillus ficulneus]|uniref:Conserved membrane protein n=1 Tax=Fructobacillus ficulneus TaxID=157463 RepID=A0A0K8MFY7_9LACO|nr:hypothetical protein [Fructobacillus ficulneus]GAO99420.1 conserved membrane protein [Fructobacillus ficulneus]
MYYRDGKYLELSWHQVYFYFFLSLFFDSLGNGLSVSTNLGSAPWTAGAANLSNVTGVPIAYYLAGTTFLVAIANIFLAHKFVLKRFMGNIAFGLMFSFLAGFFNSLFISMGIQSQALWLKIILDLFGVAMVGVAISAYQRVNFILHPIDDMTNILRFSYFHGSAPKAQMSNFIFAISISLLCWAVSGKIVALNIGTAFSFFMQGNIIAWSDRLVFPHLVHGNMDMTHKDIPVQN